MEEFKIQIEPLRKRSLMIATPCYGGQLHINSVHSMANLQNLLLQAGIGHEFRKIGNESLITRARNVMAADFLASQHTDLLFIDSDIEFDPKDVLLMLHFDKEVIGAAYPMKGIDWAQVKEIILKHPDIPVSELPSAGAQWPIHLLDGKQELKPFEPIEVFELANGFVSIKREVFEKLKSRVPEYQRGIHEKDFGKVVSDYFQVGVHDGRYESEDYGLCRLWREIGGKIWLCPWVELIHHGNYGFKGNLYKVLEMLNRDKLVWPNTN